LNFRVIIRLTLKWSQRENIKKNLKIIRFTAHKLIQTKYK